MDNVDIWVSDMLPAIYDVAMAVFHYSKNMNSAKCRQIIHNYAVAVRNVWIMSFTERHVFTVKRRIEHIMKDYEYKVWQVTFITHQAPYDL